MAADSLVRPQWQTRPLGPHFGLEISGIDITRPLDGETVAAIRQWSADHKVLVFKGQHASSEQLDAFARRFGDTDQPPPVLGGTNSVRRHNVSLLGNTESAGEAHVEPTGYGITARIWHNDSAWRPVPTWLSFLTAAEIPDAGGETEFCDLQAAWDALSPERQALLEGRQMVHSWRNLRHWEPTVPPMGDDENVPPPVTHPVVRTVNGRKGLFINGHSAYYVGNMPLEEGKALFDELIAHSTQARFVYAHAWTVGDMVMWDNRTTMHRVRPYDTRQRRVMHRAECKGTEAP